VSNLLGRDVWRIRVVSGNVALVRVTEVHAGDAGLVEVIFESGVQLLGSLAGLYELSKAFARDARDDLAVSEGSIVACVANELGGVVEEVLQVVI